MDNSGKKIAIYVRQSIWKDYSISTDVQYSTCLNALSEVERVHVERYEDKGFSGSNTRRDAFQRMIEDIRSGLIQKVVSYKLDRLSRSVLDFAEILKLFGEYDISYVSATEPIFCTGDSKNNAMPQILMVFAELERNNIIERVTDNYFARMKSGIGQGGPAPFGYYRPKKENGKVMVMYPDENAGTVKELFHMYSEGISLSKLAKYLNERGITTSRGNTWDSCRIARIIQNPAYVKATPLVYAYYQSRGCTMTNASNDYIGENGLLLYVDHNQLKKLDKELQRGKSTPWGWKRDEDGTAVRKVSNKNNARFGSAQIVTLGLHKGFIEDYVWVDCQKRLDSNEQINNAGATKHTFLSTLIKCAECGSSLTVVTSQNSKYRYLRCSGKTKGICEADYRSIKIEDIEEAVQSKLFDCISTYAGVKIEMNSASKAAIQKLEAERIAYVEKIDRLLDLFESGTATSEVINKRTKQYNERIAEIDFRINELQFTHKKLNQKQLADTIPQWDSLSVVQKRQIAKQFFKTITVSADGEKQNLAIMPTFDFEEME